MLSISSGAALALAALAAGGPLPRYHLAVRIDPDAHRISVRGRLEGRPCEAGRPLYLNRDFVIESFAVNGQETPVAFDTAAPPARWAKVTRPLRFECRAGPLEFAYAGTIADTIFGVNTIGPHLAELALYSGWFPYDPAMGSFAYDLDVDVPAGWVVASGGRATRSAGAAGRAVVHVASVARQGDIAFVASPGLVVRRAGEGAAAVEVYATAQDSALARRAVEDLDRALSLYGRWFGKVQVGAETPLPTRLVYSPRGGWAYSRLPLILMSAGTGRASSREAMGQARLLMGTAHELAHFWWHLASTETPDDWVNEGAAEFSSFSVASELFGAEVRDSLLAGYRRDVAAAKTSTPIAATTSSSPDRYVNHYEKTTLLLASVEATVGAERMRGFLRAFYAAWKGRGGATTTAFLDAARVTLGPEQAARIERCVEGDWVPDCDRPGGGGR